MGGVDLNLVGRYSEFFRGTAREHRQNAFRPAGGFSALEHLHADCCALRRRRSGADAVLCRAIPRDGVCATDLSREPARYRSLLVGSSLEALPHGLSRTGAAIDAGGCQRDARLAHLRGVRPAADCPGEEALCRRKSGLGVDQHGLRPGLDHHRPVPVAVSMGALSLHPGGGEDAPCSICAATSRASSTSRTASCTTFTPSICCSPKRAPSTSWIAATSISRAFTSCIKLAPSSSPAPNRTWMPTASTPRRPIGRPASLPTRPSRWMATLSAGTIRIICAASASRTPNPERRWCFSPTSPPCRPPRSAPFTRAVGRSSFSSNGSNTIFASNNSTARRTMP